MGREKLVGLQVLRFFAAASVALCHANLTWQVMTGSRAAIGIPTEVAVAGVDVFFVISGYVIATVGPLATPRPTARRFFAARWRRVVPVFWALSLFALGMVALWPALLGKPFAAVTDWRAVATTATLWPVWGGQVVQPSLVPGWTLCIEMIFYSFVSLALLGGKLRRNLVIIAIGAIAGLYLRSATNLPGLRVLLSPMLIEFGFGVALAIMRRRLAVMDTGLGLALIGTGLMLFTALGFLSVPIPIFDGLWTLNGATLLRPFVLGLPALLIVTGAIIAEPAFQGRGPRFIARGGDASYSIYLAQAPVLSVLWAAIPLARGAQTEFVIMAWAIEIAVGIACYLWLERPLLAALKRLDRHRAERRAIADQRPPAWAGIGGVFVLTAVIWLGGFAPAPPAEPDTHLAYYRLRDRTMVVAKQRPDLVLIGDSITRGWSVNGARSWRVGWVNRGIDGERSDQVRARFQQDVVALRPRAAVLLVGTNDAWQDHRDIPLAGTEANIVAMVSQGRAAGIRVVMAAVPPFAAASKITVGIPMPSTTYARIVAQNAWARHYAAAHGIGFADYWSVMTPELTTDGVHPSAAGYARMSVVLDQVMGSSSRKPSFRPAMANMLDVAPPN